MIERLPSVAARDSSPKCGEDSSAAAHPAPREDFARLPLDEIERLIALCEAPALLWRTEPAAARAPEPFGMIA